MKVTLLGTGTSQGIPVVTCHCEVCSSIDFRDKRLRTSALIEIEGKCIVIDTGPDFRQQMLTNRVERVDAVVFTHEHKDHTAGLDDVRSYNFKYNKDMPVYGREQVIEQLRQEFAYIFAAFKYPGIPRLKTFEITNQEFEVEGINITPIEVLHYKLPVFGFRINDFVYLTDANYISDEEKEKCMNPKVLILNALQNEPHISHFTLQEAIELAQELKAEKTYFTHISHKLGRHKDVEAKLPENIHLGYDGLSIYL
ncbi:MBL fold metallo-hydrolase [Fulvivirgaceae bacterium LMO-SS25]